MPLCPNRMEKVGKFTFYPKKSETTFPQASLLGAASRGAPVILSFGLCTHAEVDRDTRIEQYMNIKKNEPRDE